MERLVATLEKRRSGARVIKLSGVLDKDHRLDELAHETASGLAIINLAGVERVEDNNTHEWLKWLATLTPGQSRPVVIACSVAVVEELNRIDHLASKLVVKSFHIPYRCEDCSHQQLLLAHVTQFRSATPKAPPCMCDACGSAMTLEGEASKYFAFLPPLIRAVRASEAPSVREPSGEPPELARGSRAEVAPERRKRVSRPQLLRPSHSSMSPSQFMASVRGSASDIERPQNETVSSSPLRWLLVALFVMLIGMVALFAYFVAA